MSRHEVPIAQPGQEAPAPSALPAAEALSGNDAAGIPQKVIAEITLKLPDSYPVSYGLYSQEGEWTRLRIDKPDTRHIGYARITGVEVSARDEDRRIDLPGFPSLYKGLTGIIGARGSGKTALLDNLALACQKAGQSYRSISVAEPIEPWRPFMRHATIVATSDDLVEALARELVPAGPDLIVVDSLSFLAFQEWSGWSTVTSGLNSGFLYWLTALSNIAYMFGKVVVVTFNPGPQENTRGASLTEILSGFVGGRTHGFAVLELSANGIAEGTYSSRRPDGSRESVPIDPELLKGISGRGGSSARRSSGSVELKVREGGLFGQ